MFVKIPKTATEAMAAYLQPYANDEDVFSHDNGFDLNLNDPHRTHSHMDMNYILKHGLATRDNRFVGVIRNPYERLLSLYLYRQRQRRYDSKLSVEDFRHRARSGFIEDHVWHMQLQSTFLDNGEYWCYDNLHSHVKKMAREFNFYNDVLPFVNRSTVKYDTRDLIDTFYDNATRTAVNKYWERDIELYNEVKNAETGLDC